jgi:enoyl-CoA hydratase
MNEVLLKRDDGVGIIELNAPQRRNALTPSMAAELVAACDDLDADHSIGSAVLVGAGGQFCSGADRAVLSAVSADPAEGKGFQAISQIYDAFIRVGSLQMPTIAAVRGAVVGAGMNLMLATDLRIVADDVRLLSGFLRIGVHPGGGHFVLLGRSGGREAAAALGIFGAEIDGPGAVRLGVAWESVTDSEVESRALELAKHAARDPELARAAVGSLRDELGPPGISWPVGVQTERARQMWSMRRSSPS